MSNEIKELIEKINVLDKKFDTLQKDLNNEICHLRSLYIGYEPFYRDINHDSLHTYTGPIIEPKHQNGLKKNQ